MKKDIVEKLTDLGYQVNEREVSKVKFYQCAVPQEEGSLKIQAFGIQMKEGVYEFWDGRKQISQRVRFEDIDALIDHISEVFPIDSE